MKKTLYSSTDSWAKKNKLSHLHKASTISSQFLAKKNIRLFFEDKSKLPFYLTTCTSQLKGRGRGQNTWTNSKDEGSFLSTWAFQLNNLIQPIASPLIGLCLYQAFQNTWTNLNFSLKAPNDIYLNNKKLAGLLIEVISQDNKPYIFIGLGINVLSPIYGSFSSTYLKKWTTHPLEEWGDFLNAFFTNLKSILNNDCNKQNLDANKILALLTAVKKYPPYKGNLIDIKKDSSIVFKDKVVHWSKL